MYIFVHVYNYYSHKLFILVCAESPLALVLTLALFSVKVMSRHDVMSLTGPNTFIGEN